MTKTEAKAFKGIIGHKYTSYYTAKTESLSIRVYTYINNAYNSDVEKTEIEAFMDLVKDVPFIYEIKHRTYQGFIHDTCIIAH